MGIVEKEESDPLQDYYDKIVQLPNERYQAPLPWKVNCEDMPNNESLALARFKQLRNSLQKKKCEKRLIIS